MQGVCFGRNEDVTCTAEECATPTGIPVGGCFIGSPCYFLSQPEQPEQMQVLHNIGKNCDVKTNFFNNIASQQMGGDVRSIIFFCIICLFCTHYFFGEKHIFKCEYAKKHMICAYLAHFPNLFRFSRFCMFSTYFLHIILPL